MYIYIEAIEGVGLDSLDRYFHVRASANVKFYFRAHKRALFSLPSFSFAPSVHVSSFRATISPDALIGRERHGNLEKLPRGCVKREREKKRRNSPLDGQSARPVNLHAKCSDIETIRAVFVDDGVEWARIRFESLD